MVTQDQVRSIEWSRSYLWDVRFPGLKGAPAPFNTWFPATDVSIDEGGVESQSFEAYVFSFSIPKRVKERTLELTFIDDINHTLVDWITSWMYQMVPYLEESGVLPLNDAVKQLDIIRLNNRRVPIKVGNTDYLESYSVYPDGAIQFLGSSEESKVNSYRQNFIIAGVISQPSIEFQKGVF